MLCLCECEKVENRDNDDVVAQTTSLNHPQHQGPYFDTIQGGESCPRTSCILSNLTEIDPCKRGGTQRKTNKQILDSEQAANGIVEQCTILVAMDSNKTNKADAPSITSHYQVP